MTRRWLRALATLALMSSAVSAGAEIRERTLPNGLRALLVSDPGASAVDVAVWYGTGPADEPAGRTGLTHLMERMMFRGSPKFADGEYARRMRELGVSFNTFLAPDFSEFYSTGPIGSLPGMLRLEADRLAGPRLTAAAVAAEARVLRSEQERLADAPLTRGLQKLHATAFGTHPYGRPLQGRTADAPRMTMAALTEYAKGRYTPGNAFVTVVGDFDPDSAEAMLAATFGAVPSRPTTPRASASVPATGERRGTVKLPVRMLMAGWSAPPDSACGAEMAVIAHVLGSGSKAALANQLVRRQRLAVNASCEFDGRRDASLLYATAIVVPQADTTLVENLMIEQVERLAREPLSEAELASARKALLIDARVQRSGVRGRAQALGLAQMTAGNWRAAEARLDRLTALSAEDVRRVAERVLREEHRTVVWSTVAPAAKPAATKPATTSGSRAGTKAPPAPAVSGKGGRP